MKAELIVCLALLAVPLIAQSPPKGAEKPAPQDTTKPADAKAGKSEVPAAKPDKMLEALQKAKPEQRGAKLLALLEDRIATNAVFAGQYKDLTPIEGVADLLSSWAAKPPEQARDTTTLRTASIRALRDIHGSKAQKGLLEALHGMVADALESSAVRNEAVFALAQFGDRKYVDRLIQHYASFTEREGAPDRAGGHQGLANVYYQLRDYKRAIVSYKALIAMLENKQLQQDGADVLYYNAACSMALAGDKDAAIAHLGKALAYGKTSRRMLESDMDLGSLRGDPRFRKLVDGYFAKQAKQGPPKSGTDK
ncbi:MAG: hypothetical protein KDC87_17275 [Planctomycetes bacterium]|nr:hypothetical protein [Planctomycetota bacterium]